MADLTLIEEQRAFEEQFESLLASHPGKYVLFKNGKLVGFYDDHETAYKAALEKFGLDAIFLIAPIAKSEATPVSIAWDAGVMFG